MALKTIKIRVRAGGKRRREVEADVRGLFAYRLGTVTHVPTGYSTPHSFASKAEALRFMAALNAQKGWDFTTRAEFNRRRARLVKQARVAKMAALGITRRAS